MQEPTCFHGGAPTSLLPVSVPAFLRLIAEPNRLRILALLARGEQYAGDIGMALDLPQNLVSHHVSVLKQAQLLVPCRRGKRVSYAIAPQVLDDHLGTLLGLLETRRTRQQGTAQAENSIA